MSMTKNQAKKLEEAKLLLTQLEPLAAEPILLDIYKKNKIF